MRNQGSNEAASPSDSSLKTLFVAIPQREGTQSEDDIEFSPLLPNTQSLSPVKREWNFSLVPAATAIDSNLHVSQEEGAINSGASLTTGVAQLTEDVEVLGGGHSRTVVCRTIDMINKLFMIPLRHIFGVVMPQLHPGAGLAIARDQCNSEHVSLRRAALVFFSTVIYLSHILLTIYCDYSILAVSIGCPIWYL
jgi:hypothetical protein